MRNQKISKLLISRLIFFGIFIFYSSVSLAENPLAISSVALMPGRYAVVKNGDDAEKFKEDNWINDRFAAGIKHFNMEDTLSNGAQLNISGHGISGDDDYKFDSFLAKEGKYTLKMGYDKFKRFYDGTGGKYRDFTAQPVELDQDLQLNVGNFFADVFLPLSGASDIAFRYERRFLDGSKSTLNWGSFSGAGTGVTRKIVPAWKSVDEVTDKFSVTADHEIGGFKLSLNQSVKLYVAEMFKEFRTVGGTTAGFNRQDQDPRTKHLTTILKAERSFSEKIFFIGAYRFSHSDATEDEKLVSTDTTEALRQFNTTTKNFFNAFAENKFDTHTLTGDLTLTPGKSWLFNMKAKAETLNRKSASVYPRDTTQPAPDFVINDYINSANRNSACKFGEWLSIHYSGIPRTALYLEGEGEHIRTRLREDRTSSAGDAAEVFNRNTIAHTQRGVWTLGGHFSPIQKINITTHARQVYNYTDYDDQRESVFTATSALSAFVDSQRSRSDELSTKFAIKLLKNLLSTSKYMLRRQVFLTRAEAQDVVEAESYSHVYTTDLIFTPTERWSLSGTYSKQQVTTSTAARLSGGNATIPSYDAGVDTFLFSADYTPTDKLTVSSSYQWTGSANFNDISTIGMPYGLDNSLQHVKLSLNYALSADASIGGSYGYHTYTESSNAYIDDYIANVFEVNGTIKF